MWLCVGQSDDATGLEYHCLYLKVNGNVFRNKILMYRTHASWRDARRLTLLASQGEPPNI